MCLSKEALLNQCSLFPQTFDNIKRRSLERRHHFMKLKKTNSKKFLHNRGATPSKQSLTEDGGEDEDNTNYEDFTSDEEPEEDEDKQKDDMKMYLGKLNKRIDKICVALK